MMVRVLCQGLELLERETGVGVSNGVLDAWNVGGMMH